MGWTASHCMLERRNGLVDEGRLKIKHCLSLSSFRAWLNKCILLYIGNNISWTTNEMMNGNIFKIYETSTRQRKVILFLTVIKNSSLKNVLCIVLIVCRAGRNKSIYLSIYLVMTSLVIVLMLYAYQYTLT